MEWKKDTGKVNEPLTFNLSGPMCMPWTLMGKSKGYADETVESANDYQAKVGNNGITINFLEQSDAYPFSDFQEGAGSRYTCVRLVFSLLDLGIPGNRRRTYGVALNIEEVVWVGPPHAEGIREDYMQILGRLVSM